MERPAKRTGGQIRGILSACAPNLFGAPNNKPIFIQKICTKENQKREEITEVRALAEENQVKRITTLLQEGVSDYEKLI